MYICWLLLTHMRKNLLVLIVGITFVISVNNSFAQDAPADTTSQIKTDTTDASTQLPVINLSAAGDDGGSDNQGQDVAGVLQSSKDVYTSIASYNFSQAHFRIRGYNSDNNIVTINGIKVNDPETGYASFGNWGGLNEVTRFNDVLTGIGAFDYNFGGIGGASNIDTRASAFRKGYSLSYASTNRSYRNRLMFTANTGLMDNGWAFSFSISRRWAEKGYYEGTYFDSWSYFASAEKVLNNKHSLSMTVFGAPMTQGRQAVSTQEAYDLAGNNYYNYLWGYQNGEVRNSKVSHAHEPMAMLTHNWKVSDKTKLATSLYGVYGKSGITGLNWNDDKNPYPIYYKYLPSYYKDDSLTMNNFTNNWKNDENVRQVKWDDLYFANSKNLYTVKNAEGIQGNDVTGMRSKYIVEDVRMDQTTYGINAVGSHKVNTKLTLNGGINYNVYNSHNYKILDDLLGGEFWLDVNQFAEQYYKNDSLAQNNTETPNHIVKKGDKFGFDYYLHENKGEAFTQAKYVLSKLEFYGAASVSHTSFWREGLYTNAQFPADSKGNSDKQNFFNYGVKGGVMYKITGRHYITANGAYLTRAPLPKNVYMSPRTRDFIVSNAGNEQLLSGDLNYLVRYSRFKARATVYYTEINNQTIARTYFHDDYNSMVNYLMTGVNQLFTGAELGVEAKFLSSFAATAVLSKGQFVYNNRPMATIIRDNSAEVVAQDRVVYFKNYRVGGMPQTAASLGLKYNGAKFWWAGVNANFYDEIYIEPNPDRRTSEALVKYVSTDPQWSQILKQEMYGNYFTLDANVGKSFRIKKYTLLVTATVNNILDNQNIRVGGFEQLRYDSNDINKFPTKYSYHLGRTYFANLTFRF